MIAHRRSLRIKKSLQPLKRTQTTGIWLTITSKPPQLNLHLRQWSSKSESQEQSRGRKRRMEPHTSHASLRTLVFFLCRIVPAGKNVEAQYVEMKVPLYSYGCEKKVKKALSHLRGIHSVHVDYKLQKVTVWGICNKDAVLATIRKKRREARFWEQAEPEAAEGKVEDEMAVAKASRLAAAKGHRLRLSWKKLFPL